jgi:hypothetical protein
LVIYSFNWLLLISSSIGFICSHDLWPPKHEGESSWYDIFEVVIELPFRAISLFIRGLGKVLKNADSGLDL